MMKHQKKKMKISDETLELIEFVHIWDLMFEKRIGAARILTSKMLDR